MKEFWTEHKPHIVVVICLIGHQVVSVAMTREIADHYFLVQEILHVLFLG